ncbi:MAG TPA: type II toxin-antitoxin system VapC family toxin [Planctomycetota bacterium]|nr:type II toxin-antitoxin system VapC family toxin [Planctomycetota bacterium]
MKPIVIDASVVIKLFFAEEHSVAAAECVKKAAGVHAPDLLWAEIGNVIWKRHQRGTISADDAVAMAKNILQLQVHIEQSIHLVPEAVSLATTLNCTVYDCLYLALAIRESLPFVSADLRFIRALAGTPYEQHIAWIGGKF